MKLLALEAAGQAAAQGTNRRGKEGAYLYIHQLWLYALHLAHHLWLGRTVLGLGQTCVTHPVHQGCSLLIILLSIQARSFRKKDSRKEIG